MRGTMFGFAALAAVIFVPPSAETQEAADDHMSIIARGIHNKLCDCYISTDCIVGHHCAGFTGCEVNQQVKANDGFCEKRDDRGDVWPPLDPQLAARAVEGYFDAYITAGRNKGGYPDLAGLQQAQAVPLSLKAHRDLQVLVTDAMDLALGFDLLPVQPAYGSVLRRVPPLAQWGLPEALELIEAMKAGMLAAIRAGEPGLAAEPIREFWSRHAEFHPLHYGRCYPHGHRQYPYKSAETCQITEITGRLRTLLFPDGEAGREG